MKQQNILRLKKVLSLSLLLIFFIVGCKQRIKVATVQYDSKTVNEWLKNEKVEQFIFQFHTPRINSGDPLQLISYVITSDGSVLNGTNPDLLPIYKDSIINLEGTADFGNNVVLRQQFEDVIKDSVGNKRDFDYILMIPEIDKVYKHVVYDIRLVKGGVIQKLYVTTTTSNPCPPNCPKPPPPTPMQGQ